MKNFLLIFSILLFSVCRAQVCKYTSLSKNFDFTTSVKRFVVNKRAIDSCKITVEVNCRSTGKKQIISLSSGYMFSNDFQDCKNIRSYITGVNKNANADDNDYGNFIVADFNFDSREDFAVKHDSGGNGGPFYSYYIQDIKGNFALDKFLTGTMVFFPNKFNAKLKSLVTLVHASTVSVSEITYKFYPKKSVWKQVKQRIISN